MLKRILKFLYPAVFAFLIFLFVFSHFSERVSYLARRFISLPVRNFITYFTNIIPAPVFEIAALLFLFLIPILFFRVIRGKGSVKPLLVILSLFVAGYILSIGIDSTMPMEKKTEISHSEYLLTGTRIADKLNELSVSLDESNEKKENIDENFLSTLNIDKNINIPKLKSSYISSYLTQLGTLSYYSPLTMEIILNGEQPQHMKRFSAAHELAHYLGYIREDEASFYAFRFLLSNSDMYDAYSAYLYAFVAIGAKIYQASYTDYFELYEKLPPRVKKDLKIRADFLAKEEKSSIGDKLNDKMLEAVDSRGAASYKEAAPLIAELVLKDYG